MASFGLIFSPLNQPALIIPTIIQALGLSVSPPTLAALQRALKPYTLLLVLDNCEHLLAVAPVIQQLLAAAPGLRVLATSRITLHLSGEHQVVLDPLPVPSAAPDQSVAEIAASGAVDLLVQRARLACPDFALTDSNAAAVAAICQRLDGLPLALELAAAWLKHLSPALLLDQLQDRFALLTDGPHDFPARHRGLAAAIAWSYHLLTAPEQQLFVTCAAFPAGWDIAAISAVSAPPAVPALVLRGLAALQNTSLIRRVADDLWTMLESLRAFALSEPACAPLLADVRARQLAYYLDTTAQAQREREGPDAQRWIGWLAREAENIRAVLGWAAAAGEHAAVAGIATNMWEFWVNYGYAAEGAAWTERALAAGPELSPATHATVLHRLAILVAEQGQLPRAQQLLAEAITIRRAAADWEGVARTLMNLAWVIVLQGDLVAGQPLMRESIALATAHGDLATAARALTNLGRTLHTQGQLPAARAAFEESLAIWQQLGTAQEIIGGLQRLAELAVAEHDQRRAAALYADSLAPDLTCRMMHILALESAAGFLATYGAPDTAVIVWQAVQRALPASGYLYETEGPAAVAAHLAQLRQTLGPAKFAAQWSRAHSIALDDAIALARAALHAIAAAPAPRHRVVGSG